MAYKKTVIGLLAGLLMLSACSRTAPCPSGLTLSELGPDPQTEMERLLAPLTTSVTSPPSVPSTAASALPSRNF